MKQHDAWIERSQKLLEAARGDEDCVAAAVTELARSAFNTLHYSPYVVWDYLAISSPGLFEKAGYPGIEIEALMPVIEKAMAEASRDPATE
jgi:hypothetical protein